MSKNVCMFVWNHFTNDARVLRECTALSEEGYKVDLICIDDPNDPAVQKYEERNENFSVYRVRRYPWSLQQMQRIYKLCFRRKKIGILAFILWMFLMYLNPIIFGTLTLIGLILLKSSKIRALWIKSNIIVRMIARGFQKKYDIYHSNDLNTLPQGYMCAKLFRLKRKRLIYDSHEVQTSRTGYDSKLYAITEKFFINKIDEMIVENHTRAKYNEDLYGFYPHVVHNYPFKQSIQDIAKAPLHKILNLPPDEKILLYQGGIQAGRGLENLVKAAPLFNKGTLVFIGDGKIKPKLQQMVEEMNLSDKVKFLPKVPVEELPSYTKNAYLGFQVLNNTNFNHYSASSNKLFEYMMAGVPVVACSFPEISKIVLGENVGICVDSHNINSIAKGTNILINNDELMEEYTNNCLRSIEKFNWNSEQKSLLNIYR